MKKLVYTAFVFFWAAIATLAATAWLQEPERAPVPPVGGQGLFSLEEVRRHDGPEDCWMAIEGSVYDLTGYVPRHPAPLEVIVAWCGRQATEAMRTRGNDGRHSDRAWRLLERYRIGTLDDS